MAEPLRNSDAYFRAITHQSSDIVFVVDREGTITYANPSAERFLGYSLAELIGKSAFDLIAPADLPRAIRDFAEAVATTAGKVIPNAFHVRHRDGSERILEGVGTNLLEDPAVQGFVMNVRDVTEWEVHKSARRESDQKFKDLAEKSPVGIYILQGGKFRYINARFAEMHGYSIAEMTDRIGPEDVAHPDDWPLVEKVILDAIAGTTETYRSELRACRKSGEIIHLEVYGSATLFEGKRAAIGTALDITERKRAEDLLKESKAHLEELVAERTADLRRVNEKLEQEIREKDRIREALIRAKNEWEQTFDAVPDLISIIDSGNRIVRLNKAMAAKMGLLPQQAVGLKCHTCIHGTDEPPSSCPHAQFLKDGKEHAAEVYVERWGGTYRISASPLHDAQGQPAGCVHVARDITESKRAEESLERMVTERTAELYAKNEQLVQEIRERKRAETALRRKTRELERHTAKLEEFNVALKVLLDKREGDRTDLEDKVMANLKHLVFPHVEALKTKIRDKESRILLEVLEGNLQKVTSSFSQRLSSQYMNLTPTEIKVANLVKEGKSIKEIAEMMAVSHFTIDIHRFHIRKKLGLKSRKINLQSYLQSLS
ncbi:MAG: PAS domain S-box protein [Deltaproteobacteria bacterium]|nr:PAS domain S-box protein [Deltaproteobacteria bacterium]